MDSLTQIVLGAAVGEAVLGRKIGNRAMLYGAIAGTIPDLDIIASFFTNTVSALEIHRGFTHSIFFSVVFAPVFAWLVTRYDKHKSIKDWSWLFFWTFITHPILDAHTTWGTQLFWPFDLRLAFKTIFVIDPLYTLPFLVFLIMALLQHRSSNKRRKYNRLGLLVSTLYLALTFVSKGIAYNMFENALEEQGIVYNELETKPAPFNTILWCANVETDSHYLIGYYSFFDSQPITFIPYPKHHEYLGDLIHSEKIQRMIAISKGWYTITKKEGDLYFNDLRFGLLSIQPEAKNFVFSYLIAVAKDGDVSLIEAPKGSREGKKLLIDLWQRVKGN
ncbi:metal-dependent hydrolase [Bizionia gelidisalsuginis]|uniref:Metal-dependent hydrolase n=1 Tax=Bizionia gelidisalsuginis TaxID=291188 RepID=A0ABY3M923_9FLAO|nr:metal-dependent hydrolase [Bizionia gelidisalsuginis]TYC10769.1 metal-dependent hydrolase [Bizionia gelidisalsuginis]